MSETLQKRASVRVNPSNMSVTGTKMPLKSGRAKGLLSSTTVEFAMRDGEKIVVCAVTQEALDNMIGAARGTSDYLVLFEIYRAEIERYASRKYERGLLQDGGTVLVSGMDLSGA